MHTSPLPSARSTFTRSTFTGSIVSNTKLCAEHFRLVIGVARDFPPTQPGHFVQLLCRDLEPALINDHDPDIVQHHAFLRRPFSLAGRVDQPDGSTHLHVIHRVVGVGTEWLSHLKPGGSIGVLGPLGNTFTLPNENETAILIGGGVGIPPMLYLAESLASSRIKTLAFCGAVSRDLLPLTILEDNAIDEFARHGIDCIISTDDGSFGHRGYVTAALEEHLGATQPTNAILYTCGPEPMMKRVGQLGAEHRLSVQIAVERAMACGMGTCQSCCIRVVEPKDPDGWRYKLACTDGPIFPAEQLLW